MREKVWLIYEGDDAIAAVATEADAEELYMDLIMEIQYEVAMSKMHFQGYSIERVMECDWIWMSNWEYSIGCVTKLF